MGCSSSRLDDLQVVVLCRDRCRYIKDAIRNRYVFAEAHVDYFESLRVVGASLDRLFSQDLMNMVEMGAGSGVGMRMGEVEPVLNLPGNRKGESLEYVAVAEGGGHSRSNSGAGSHIKFHSETEDEGSDGSHDIHSDNNSSDETDEDEKFGLMHGDHDEVEYGVRGTKNAAANEVTPQVAYDQSRNANTAYQQPGDANEAYQQYGNEAYLRSGNGAFQLPGNANLPNSYYNNVNIGGDSETLGPMPGGYMNSMNDLGMNGYGGMNMHYMRNQATPSVIHQQRPLSPETGHMGGGGSYPSSSAYPSSSTYPPPYQYNQYPNQGNPIPHQSYNNYEPAYPPSFNTYDGGFYGLPIGYGSSPPPQAAYPHGHASTSKPPPPPPSPPRNSPWDFLNPFPFDNLESRYYAPNSPSRDSKEVREEEGIPDLEDDHYDEVVKEVHGEQKFSNVNEGSIYSEMSHDDGDHEKGKHVEEVPHGKRPSDASVAEKNKGVEYDVHEVQGKKVAERSIDQDNIAAFQARVSRGGRAGRGIHDVMREIKAEFDRASESGNEVSKMLEVGKVPCPQRNVVYEVSSKMLHSVTPSLSVTSTSKSAETSSSTTEQTSTGSVFSGYEEDLGMRSGSLSSTLLKLKIWEKKLYDEVKAEEKIRVYQERKSRKLKDLDSRGAEAHKVHATRELIRSLNTKLRVAVQVIDKISEKINKLRDEELWPQITELINGLILMWKVMLECHHNQCQAITEAKIVPSNFKFGDAHFDVLRHLELALLKWASNFRSWVISQREYSKAVNSWLLKNLPVEPEETPDGRVPFSPGRIGAPPVFVICNQWAQSMEEVISEEEVLVALRTFTLSIQFLREQHIKELRMRPMVDTKALERDELRMQKEWQKVDKELLLAGFAHVRGVHTGDPAIPISLQEGLKKIFETMERFTAKSMSVYEQLLLRSDDLRLSQDNSEVI